MAVFVQFSTAQTFTADQIGSQGGYNYEFWRDNATGTASMTLGDGGNYSCTWNNISNVLSRKGLRPGVKNQVITYSGTYAPVGNSYMAVYGWTTSPLIEYYIVENWGTWRPPGETAKGTVTSDGGTYDIYETTRTNAASIEGFKTFQQFWSVRQSKKPSGTITCANHFNAWAAKGMAMGSLYEVSFVIEGYQSSGSTDVKMSMGTGTGIISNGLGSVSPKKIMMPINGYQSSNVYNTLGQKIAESGGREYSAGQHSVIFNPSNIASGVYFYPIKTGD